MLGVSEGGEETLGPAEELGFWLGTVVGAADALGRELVLGFSEGAAETL